MCRSSMAILKANARYVLRGLEIIVPQAMHTHVARRARSEAAREADFDEHRADVRGFGCDGDDGRDYAYCAKWPGLWSRGRVSVSSVCE